MATDPMTAPDLDALAGLLEDVRQFIEYARYELQDGPLRLGMQFPTKECADKRIAAIDAALPALLATAKRERRYREALDAIPRELTRVPQPNILGALRLIDAALAEEGQDVE